MTSATSGARGGVPSGDRQIVVAPAARIRDFGQRVGALREIGQIRETCGAEVERGRARCRVWTGLLNQRQKENFFSHVHGHDVHTLKGSMYIVFRDQISMAFVARDFHAVLLTN